MLSATEIPSTSAVKRLAVEQGRFLKREYWIRNCKFQQNCKLQGFILKVKVPNYELNLEIQFSKKCSQSRLTASC